MSISRQWTRWCACALVVCAGMLWCAAAAEAQPKIVLGPADGLLLGQPEVFIGLEDPSNPDVLVGPPYDNVFVLDTAANGILFAARSYWTDENVPDPSLYAIEQNAGGNVQYTEQGVAGTEELDVFVPYNVYIAGSDINTEFLAGQFRPFGSSTVDLGDIAGLAGMPVMINHGIRVNLHDLINPDTSFQMTTVFDDTPAPTPTTYIINLDRLPAEHAGQHDAGDPVPDFADIPIISNTRLTSDTASVTVNAILDTGAQLSIISYNTALALGIDPDNDAIEFTTVGGIGGEAMVPIVHVGELAIPTASGIDLVFTDMDMVVIDVAGLDAIIGMDVLSGGYLTPYINAFFAWMLGEPIPEDYGYFADMIFDFTGDQWSLRLDVNPAYNNVIPEPATMTLLAIGGLAMMRRRRLQ